MATRFRLNFEQIFGTSAQVLAGGTLTFCISGGAPDQLQAIYQDDALTVTKLNPVTLDSAGKHGDIFLQAKDYRVIVKDAAGIVLPGGDVDPVHGGVSDAVVTIPGGSSSQTLGQRFSRPVNVFDYMTNEQIADVEAGTKLLDVSGAFTAAIATNKLVHAYSGDYRIDSTIVMEGAAKGISGEGRYATRLWPKAGITAITLGSTVSAQGGLLEHFGIKGNGSAGYGLQIGSIAPDTSHMRYVADWLMLNCNIEDFSALPGNGVRVVCSQQFHMQDCGLVNNYYHLYRPDLDPTLAYMTVFLVSGMNTRLDRATGSAAIILAGQCGTFKMTDGTIAENNGAALYAGAPTTTAIGSMIQLARIFFEANNTGNLVGLSGEITVAGRAVNYQETVLQLDQIEWHAQSFTFPQLNLDWCIADIRRQSGFAYNKAQTTANTQAVFDMNGHNAGNAADHFTQVRALPGVIIAHDRVYQGFEFVENSAGRVIVRTTVQPATGTWGLGDIAINISPSNAGVLFWVCTAAGTPGTWKTVSNTWQKEFPMPDTPPPPARARAEDYASVASLALARTATPRDVRVIAQEITDRTPLEFGARLRFKLWVNSQPDLPFIW